MPRPPAPVLRRARARARAAVLLGLAATLAACGGGGGDATTNPNPGTVDRALNDARAAHAMATLANGDLLIVGGIGAAGAPLATCEVYDLSASSTTNAVLRTGGRPVPRARATATTLGSGQVLVVGGSPSGVTEVFTPNAGTPTAGTWAVTSATLVTPRSRHVAVRLLDGRVLVAGGEDAGGAGLASCELFVAAGSPMAPASPLGVARRDATATLLPDGKVLVVGGRDGAGVPLATAELYDPALNTWTPTAGPLATARSLHSAVFLDGADANPANDRVWIAGGCDGAGFGVEDAEVYEPATRTFASAGDLAGPAVFDAAAVRLANGQAALVGGFTRGGAFAPTEPVRESLVYRLGAATAVGAQDVAARRGALRAAVIPSSGPAGSSLVITGGFDDDGVAQDEVYVLPIDDELTALADTLTDEEALGVGVFATAFHLFQDGLVGGGDVELGIVHDPVRGRRVRGWVGNFEVTLEVDAGSIVGDVEGKPYAMTVTSGYVSSPDFQVDYRHATYVAGDMDVDGQDFDFDVDRAPGYMRGWVTGFDDEAELRVEVDVDVTDPYRSYLDVYWI
ncbi:MAG: kelch repeat-containing protein [Planctomycetota bacterium]